MTILEIIRDFRAACYGVASLGLVRSDPNPHLSGERCAVSVRCQIR
jgi:hypothetical protein